MRLILTVILLAIYSSHSLAEEPPLTPATVIENSSADDWRSPNQNNLVYLELEQGVVVFELAPDFAPMHTNNLRTLISQQYFDGLAILRSQDNYVVQWGDPAAEENKKKSLGKAKSNLAPEFYRALKGLSFSKIGSQDAYADHVGFKQGFAAAHDGENAWLTHCYGALGAGRGLAANSGNAAELYVVTGHSPRHLDKNVTLLGRAIHGIEHLSSLPRGTGRLGFYESEAEHVEIESIRLGSDLDAAEQIEFEIMRTDTDTFSDYVSARTFRKNEWFLDETGRIELCNVGVPVKLKNH